MHTLLLLNSILQWAFVLALLGLLPLWVFEYKFVGH
jgi:hypothetical protein